MDTYIATFFSHFGAVRFGRQLRQLGINHTLMPVPRRVSSSCGTCVRFQAAEVPEVETDDLERLFRQTGDSYEEIFSNL